MIEYYQLPDRLVSFTLTRNRLLVEAVTLDQQTLKNKVEGIRRRLQRKLSIDDESVELFKTLMPSLSNQLTGINHLIIIPTGALHYLPFALLKNSEGEYLIDYYTLSYAPSANIFSFCRERASKQPSNSLDYVLAIGNPETQLPYENLFFSEKEIYTIGFTFENAAEE